ncbi:hypothetical protein BVH01_00210 [Pseudomonas sp. PA1(2017)]|uniref:hypothetical protein n=1 Tax=Pseudomonas sp. PA1(2017) TaxID=1932113 RepID=UPI00095D89E3|nr:hypothetical protein [Pseudomonas sp. PA1(2017)]OLU20401.1 hypothetical protein BVH01_00210 [Pseudomonas sp. PA1(2017)]
MNQASFTLWQAIEQLAQQAPLTKAKIEQTLGSPLQLDKQDEHRARWVGGDVALLDNVRIAQIGFTVLSKEQASGQGTVGLFLSGACIGREELQARYGGLQLVSAPRGRSLHESSVWESTRPWGQLRFAFKQNNPECLHSVSLVTAAPALPDEI